MKRVAAALGLVALLGALSLAAAGCASDAAPSSTPSSQASIVATVDGLDVAQTDIDVIRAEWRLTGESGDAEAARDEAVRRLLVRRQASDRGVAVRPVDLEQRLAALADRFGGDDVLTSALEAADMTSAQLEEATLYSLLETALQDEMFASLTVSDAAARWFYERQRADLFTEPARVRLRLITVPTEATAVRLAAEIAAGASFAAVAKRSSSDPETRDQGGALGWVAVSSLPEVVGEAVETTRRGHVSEPVKFYGRWHLYLVEARRDATAIPYAGVAAEIKTELTRRKRAAALDRWAASAAEQADVVLSP